MYFKVLMLKINEKLFSADSGGVKPYYISPIRLRKYSSGLSIPIPSANVDSYNTS
jgi:hypothetical protein